MERTHDFGDAPRHSGPGRLRLSGETIARKCFRVIPHPCRNGEFHIGLNGIVYVSPTADLEFDVRLIACGIGVIPRGRAHIAIDEGVL